MKKLIHQSRNIERHILPLCLREVRNNLYPRCVPDNCTDSGKRQRLVQAISEAEDEEGGDDASSAFSQQISRFKKSPMKKGDYCRLMISHLS